jgi:hypothetical protein
MSLFSSQNSDEDTNATLLEEAFQPRAVVGWTFRRDRLDKPYGWIADSNPQEDSVAVQVGNQLTFEVLLVTGTISVTYLSSYENSGIFEVYMGLKDHSSNGGIQRTYPIPPWTMCKSVLEDADYLCLVLFFEPLLNLI